MPSKTLVLGVPANLPKELTAEIDKVVGRTAQQVEADAVFSMTGAKSGNVYRRKGKTHQASAPGEAPAVDEGNIFNTTKAVRVDDLTWIGQVSAEEGVWMEFGTSRVAPRPFLGPALEKNRAAFVAGIKRVIS